MRGCICRVYPPQPSGGRLPTYSTASRMTRPPAGSTSPARSGLGCTRSLFPDERTKVRPYGKSLCLDDNRARIHDAIDRIRQPDGQAFVDHIPRDQPVVTFRLDEVERQPRERLVRGNEQRARIDGELDAIERALQSRLLVALERARRLGELSDRESLHCQLLVARELLDL